MSDIAIRVENLSKEYRIGSHQNGDRRFGYKSLRDVLTDALAAPWRRASRLLRGEAYAAAEMNETIWALKDVSFEIKRGEVVGIIGRNGAGKSTLLKILSRITEPTHGEAIIYGRVGSLLEVGTGFHPELTGRENIYLNGAILGMTRADIDRKFDEMVAFAEVEKFIDTPVKHYSSGMYLRLAFAVAAHLEPEILLVDEVLAVGDVRFQKKCMDKMGEVGKQGRTVLFVSHNMPAITRLCPRTILLSEGDILIDDLSSRVVGVYLNSGLGTSAIREWPNLAKAPGDEVVRLRAVWVQTKNGKLSEVADISQPVGIEITYDVLEPGWVLVPGCRVSNQNGVILFQTNDWNPTPRLAGRYKGTFWIPGQFLAEGTFYVSVALSTPTPKIIRFFEKECVAFQVVDGMGEGSIRAMWGGDIVGVVRPHLPWQTTGPLLLSSSPR